jgi:hypothetical protein
MWYAPYVSNTAESLIGKPLVVYIDGERRQIGSITNAELRGDKFFVAGKLDSGEELAGNTAVGALFDELHEDA